MERITHRPAGQRVAALAFAAGLVVALTGCATSLLPVQVLTPAQTAQVAGFTEISLANAGFTTAALANVITGPNGSLTDVSRGGAAISATYAHASLPFPNPPTVGPATTAAPTPDLFFEFAVSGDSGQSWATMRPAGMPYLFAQAFGKATASGTASWRARVLIPANATTLYVQFKLPAADVQGFTEENAPAQWQSRLRAELQMNGHPVWFSENTLFGPTTGTPSDGSGNCGGSDKQGDGGPDQLANAYLTRFGNDQGFATTGVTSGNTGDSSAGAKTVSLSLGAFPAGQTVEVAMITRADAMVTNPCCPKMTNTPQAFCTRATTALTWDDAVVPVRFWVGPGV